jgi:hypothetical protein
LKTLPNPDALAKSFKCYKLQDKFINVNLRLTAFRMMAAARRIGLKGTLLPIFVD